MGLTVKEPPETSKHYLPDTNGEGQQLSCMSQRLSGLPNFCVLLKSLFRSVITYRSFLQQVGKHSFGTRENTWTWKTTWDVSTPWAQTVLKLGLLCEYNLMLFVRGKKRAISVNIPVRAVSARTLQVKVNAIESSSHFLRASLIPIPRLLNTTLSTLHPPSNIPAILVSALISMHCFYLEVEEESICFSDRQHLKTTGDLGLRNGEHFHIRGFQWDWIYTASRDSSVRDLAANSQANKRNTDLFSDVV